MSDVNDLLHNNDGIHLDAVIGFLQGQKTERERIVKLLKPEVARHYELGLDASAAYLEQTIDLIKGEQK